MARQRLAYAHWLRQMRRGAMMNVQARNGTGAAPTAGWWRAWCERVRLGRWAHFLVLPLATYDPFSPCCDALLAAVRGVASAFALLTFGYLLNSVSDRQMDLDARKNPFIANGVGEHRHSLTGALLLSVLLALFSPWPAQIATAVCLAFGCVYSMGPRIKSIPFVGTLANLGNFGPLLFVGMSDATLPPHFGYVALIFGTLLLQNQLIHEAADALEDHSGGLRTTWLALGQRWTAVLASFLGLGATAAATRLGPSAESTAFMGVTVFGAGFPVLLAWRGAHASDAARLRVTHRWCALAFGIAIFTAWRWGTR